MPRFASAWWVVGMSYLIGVLIAQYWLFDQPTFFGGILLIVIFSVKLNGCPSICDAICACMTDQAKDPRAH